MLIALYKVERKDECMIGILVLSHGNLAQGIVESGKMIVGSNEKVDYLGLYEGNNIDEFYDKTAEKIQEMDDGEGVLVFSDLYGASPFKATAYCVKKLPNTKYRSISGVNFSMFIESVLMRSSMELDELVTHIMHTGKAGIKELFTEAQTFAKEEE
ncbi:PTS sugar transporter subunit IIA [Enterococcus casseliflavus]|uniref:PTS sugar transporter subunit IIA n=1 Tax=Enterococcus casseliflavus TaxID=37734 RepID=UPI003DA3ACDE